MKTRNCFVLLPLLGVLTIGALNADSMYQDPQRRFTIAVPQGWSPSAGDANLQLSRGKAFVTLLWMDRAEDPQGLVSQVLQQFSGQWKNLRPAGSTQVAFGGQHGMASVVVGMNPKGVQSFAAVTASAVNDRAFVLIESGPLSEYQNLAAEMDRIAASFAPALSAPQRPGAPRTTAPQNPSQPRDQDSKDSQSVRAFAGHWTYYDASRGPGGHFEGSSSKEYFIDGNGHFLYRAATYISDPNLSPDINPITEIRGSFRVQGNTLYYQSDNGQAGSFQFEFLEGGKAMRIGGNLFVRE